ncbi:hypothetical protein [Piscinibacter sakaiensis]|uniref:Hypothetical signal peptide protein n=1 Tax=Piscinibacter sakaiensis TaxID=1547922 RepID=A0A0K8NYJ7_PISS1|nr:hypothetical protein [Piscinibacter sakaiensis]GAP35456.1 hypothetical signal peptide protein [Piscinibacter sakaiensis]
MTLPSSLSPSPRGPRLHAGALLAAALMALAGAAQASSTAASSASDSIGTSVGSLSGSVEQSSKGSSRATGVAEGEYRVIQVAEAAEGPVRVTLQPLARDAAPDAGLVLLLPRAVAQREGLVAGETVSARHQPYGVAFARGEPRQPFFLLLADAWLPELRTTPLAP